MLGYVGSKNISVRVSLFWSKQTCCKIVFAKTFPNWNLHGIESDKSGLRNFENV